MEENLKRGDKIKITPEEGTYKGMELICTVERKFRVFSPKENKPVKKIMVRTEVNGKQERFTISDNTKYEKVE